MTKYGHSQLYDGEKIMLLNGPFNSYKWPDRMPWFTKDKVIYTINNWDFSSFNIRVNKILQNGEYPWNSRNDEVDREQIAFDMYNRKDLDELVGYLFQASIDGYTIRYVSTDTLTGIYLEKSKDNSTNIDEDVLTALVEAVEEAIEDRKPKDD
jgi:hypothetical protein